MAFTQEGRGKNEKRNKIYNLDGNETLENEKQNIWNEKLSLDGN